MDNDIDHEGYAAIVNAARIIAITGNDKGSNQYIDDTTRDAARSFLRSEFERWEERDTDPLEPEPDEDLSE